MQFTAEHVAAAVATATADMTAAIATARAEATTAERERIAAVLALPAASGKERQALALAMSGAEPAQAGALLAVTPPDSAPAFLGGQRSKDAAGGLVIDAHGDGAMGPEASAAWGKSVARANERFAAAAGVAK
ncbi:MAG: hypothetical protein JWQ94_87 [Tardiphaga sp.]|nr:hypothetical protein [Tardiphaga sp.]